MGPMSGAFQVLMAGAAVAGLAVVVWAWPRFGGRRGAHVAGRIGLLAGSQVLVAAAALVIVNGYFGFASSWPQVVGAGRAPAAGPGAAASAAARPEPSLVINRAGPARSRRDGCGGAGPGRPARAGGAPGRGRR